MDIAAVVVDTFAAHHANCLADTVTRKVVAAAVVDIAAAAHHAHRIADTADTVNAFQPRLQNLLHRSLQLMMCIIALFS